MRFSLWKKQLTIATIYQTKYGHYWNRIYPDKEDNGEELPKITDDLSMQFFGYFAREHRGGIYRPTTANGERYISDFAVGGTRGYGKNCLKYL